MGIGFKGSCYDTLTDAANAFKASVPDVHSGIVMTVTAVTEVAPNSLQYTIQQLTLSTNAAVTRTNTVVLPSCNRIMVGHDWLVVVMCVAIAFMFVIGFGVGRSR